MMRSKAERKFWDEKNFISIQGSAEKTCLGKKSVNLVAAGLFIGFMLGFLVNLI